MLLSTLQLLKFPGSKALLTSLSSVETGRKTRVPVPFQEHVASGFFILLGKPFERLTDLHPSVSATSVLCHNLSKLSIGFSRVFANLQKFFFGLSVLKASDEMAVLLTYTEYTWAGQPLGKGQKLA